MLLALQLLAEAGKDGAANQPGLGSSFLIPMALVFVFMYFFLIRAPMKKQEKERQAMYASLKKNQKVVTSGGIIGIVASVSEKEDEVTLKVDESSNVRLRVLKSSIARILNGDENKDQKEGSTKQ